jgi:hypothetical protein
LYWTFTFSSDHVERLRQLSEDREVELNVILVCWDAQASNRHICMIYREEIPEFLDMGARDQSQTITVGYHPGTRQRLRVSGWLSGVAKLIARSRLHEWRASDTHVISRV